MLKIEVVKNEISCVMTLKTEKEAQDLAADLVNKYHNEVK